MKRFKVTKYYEAYEYFTVKAETEEAASELVISGQAGEPDDVNVKESEIMGVSPAPCTEDFSVGEKVNVIPKEKTIYKRFTGIIQEINTEYVVVESEDGEKFSVAPEELSCNTDDIVHGNS